IEETCAGEGDDAIADAANDFALLACGAEEFAEIGRLFSLPDRATIDENGVDGTDVDVFYGHMRHNPHATRRGDFFATRRREPRLQIVVGARTRIEQSEFPIRKAGGEDGHEGSHKIVSSLDE